MKNFFTIAFMLLLTGVLSAQTIFGEDFENGVPSGWTAENLWSYGNNTALQSQFFAIPEHTNFMCANDDAAGNGTNGDGMLISPPIDLSNATNPFLSFEAYFIDGDYGADEKAQLLVTTDSVWTELVDLSGTADEWQKVDINLGAYTGQVIQIAFSYLDGGGWNYGYAVDDIEIFEPLAIDIGITQVSPGRKYGFAPFTTPISGTVINNGIADITSFDINWTDGTDTYTETITGVNIPTFGSYNFSHGTNVEIDSPTDFVDFDFFISNINGEGDDGDVSNNSLGGARVSGLSFEAPVTVVAEEATGTWCTWCPRGHVFMDQMEEEHGEGFIGIAVHGGTPNEPMYIPEYDDFGAYISGYPSGAVNRVMSDVDPSDFGAAYNQMIDRDVPAELTVDHTFNEGNGLTVINIEAKMAAHMAGDYRISVVITQDSVQGPGDGTNANNLDYDQVNNYANNAYGPMGGYESLPNPVPATQMYYMQVARAILGGFDGGDAILPATMTQDETYTQTFTYSLPSSFNPEHIKIVALLLDGRTGEILNGVDKDLLTPTSVNNIELYEKEVTVFPNPFSEVTNVGLELDTPSEVSMVVYNNLGQQVAARSYGELSGEVLLPFNAANFAEGIYQFHISINGKIITKKVVLTK